MTKETDLELEHLRSEVSRLRMEMAKKDAKIDVLMELLGHTKAATPAKEPARPSGRAEQAFHSLTLKQHATLQMLMLGASNLDIADRLQVTESTAKVFVRSIMKKFGARGRTHAALMARAVVEGMAPEEYERATGLRVDWAANFYEADPVNAVIRKRKRI